MAQRLVPATPMMASPVLGCPDCGVFRKWVDCHACDGTGDDYEFPESECSECDGDGGKLVCPVCKKEFEVEE